VTILSDVSPAGAAGLVGRSVHCSLTTLGFTSTSPPIGLTAGWPRWLVAMVARLDAAETDTEVGDAAAMSAARSLVIQLFELEGQALVRLARLFVDDRNAAEDLVQEAFIRLARSAHRIREADRAPAYLRSIVVNLARDHNRRGLVSLRHHLPFDDARAATEDVIDLSDDQTEVVEALRELPRRQRDCLVLRYYEEQGIDEIAATLGISRNSVKTHLTRGMQTLRDALGDTREVDA
jgi:RNA polymerase sigma-70 factor (sigma-E family)